MKKIAQRKKEVKRKVKSQGLDQLEIASKVELIQALIPIALMAVEEELQREVESLAGKRYARDGRQTGFVRWSSQRGSVYLGDQKIPVHVPRVRNQRENKEVKLGLYQKLQTPKGVDQQLLHKVLKGLSCRDYKGCSQMVPDAFGLSASTVSRRFIDKSQKNLKSLFERRLDQEKIIALFLDGKSFSREQMVIALGITEEGKKMVLGFIQTETENEKACSDFLRQLVDRGLSYEDGIFCVMDGSKGFQKSVKTVFGNKAIIQRCQWHKRENVVSYMPKTQQAGIRKKLQQAYSNPTYVGAKKELLGIKKELNKLNESAARSMEEGLEETLTLHRLGLYECLGTSFKTTNCIESVNARIGQMVDKVDRWKNSNQKQRWLATALLEIEKGLRKVKGYQHLPELREKLKDEVNSKQEVVIAA